MRTLAANHGGKCLSENYINQSSKLKWRCKEGHEWEATPGNIKSRGAWCMKCAGLDRLTIEEMRKLAVEHGGECLSTIYKNSATKLLWRCADGHEWKATPSSITSGRWCPYCVTQIRENICRLIFENIFKLSFPKQKPKWLKNSRNNQMELDGYCEKLALAFEYHGEQHTTLSFFSNSENKLLQRKTDDELRRQLCKNRGIKLIEIFHTVDNKDLYDFIIFECKKNYVPIPEHEVVDYKKLKSIFHRQNIQELQRFATKHGGRLLSSVYLGISTGLHWQCANGHQWKARPNNVKRGQWCPYCARKVKLTIEEMRKLTVQRGGKCLSTKYTSNKTKLRWQCKKGHEWEAIPHNIKQGHWCSKCSKIKPVDNDAKIYYVFATNL